MELLKDIYKFDLELLFEKLNSDNFCQYFNINEDIIKSNSIEIKFKQKFCDKILIFCLNNLFLTNDSVATTTILQYIQLCSQYASKNILNFLLKYYINNFIKCIQSNNSNLNLNTTKTAESINRRLLETTDEKHKNILKIDIAFTINQINLLNNYYNIFMQSITTQTNDKSIFIDENKKFLESLVEISLSLLYEMDNSSINLIRLCVHTIEKLIKLNSHFKLSILSKCFDIINTSYDELFNNEKNLITDKKRLESHCEDINMHLLTTLADYIITSDTGSIYYLDKYQFWYILQVSLTHTNALTRKRSLYLLKRTIDFSTTNNFQIVCPDSGDKNYCLLFDSFSSVWNDYFLCVELFEETSVRDFNHIFQEN